MTDHDLRARLQQSFDKQAYMATAEANLDVVARVRVGITSELRPELGQLSRFAARPCALRAIFRAARVLSICQPEEDRRSEFFWPEILPPEAKGRARAVRPEPPATRAIARGATPVRRSDLPVPPDRWHGNTP